MILSLVHDYVKWKQPKNLEELQKAFPRNSSFGPIVISSHFVEDINHPYVQKKQEEMNMGKDKRFFFDHPIQLGGRDIVVTNQFGVDTNLAQFAVNFGQLAGSIGYKLYRVEKSAGNSSYWYVNTGQHSVRSHRAWKNCLRYGFIAGGQDDDPNLGRSSAGQLRSIPLGAIVFAYVNGAGYVGCGVVTQQALPIQKFIALHLEEQLSIGQDVPDWEALSHEIKSQGADDQGYQFKPEREFAIGVDWLPECNHPEGILQQHSGRGTAHSFNSSDRLDALKREFGIIDEKDDIADN